MKICWDTLEGVVLTKTGKHFKKRTTTLVYKDSCLECGDPFLYCVSRPTDYCSKSCVRMGNRNPLYGKTHTTAVRKILSDVNVGRSPSKKTRKKMSCARLGSRNHNWKGGISKKPYCYDWTTCLKELIKERDDYQCLNPYCIFDNPKRDLNVHHIDYNKKNCNQKNLITICRSCNAKANYNRDWHEAWYKAIIYRRYGKEMKKINE